MSMAALGRYLEAATRENTRQSYAQATRHFEQEWGGLLPATPDAVARYLAHFAGALSNNTLRQRLAALSRWHAQQGFADPTRDDLVRRTFKGIRALHANRGSKPRRYSSAHLSKWRGTASTRPRKQSVAAIAVPSSRHAGIGP